MCCFRASDLREPACKLRDGALRNPPPVLKTVFTEGDVVRRIRGLLAPHDAPAGGLDKATLDTVGGETREEEVFRQNSWVLPGSVEDESGEEDDEEVVGVPEDFEVAASDHLHGGRDDEDEGQGDDHPREARDGGEDKVGGDLLRILRGGG